ncbi:MAG TPA: 50S ribosomal protein L22 [Candidatus Paceibacterota bacterium]|jgi:large subunit ribosomal protein L22|nr:50S ribosomal protein L22 [Candidatus Paceibacterota bacterium]HJN62718.1 50S ribosomal protein L22 [Candidatus Paceibacterota bacterium]|tara:strand:+ start:6156 stop:6527 length:372 start_codon:yes stop_codon:yes gene_type:complete
MRAYLKNYRQSPRKVRLVSDLIKGKSVVRASTQLNFLNKRASKVVGKLIDSAVSNAKENDSVNKDDLFVKSIKVDEGPTLKRMRPRARGSAYLIRKRTSNITLELGKKVPKKAKVTKKTKSKK